MTSLRFAFPATHLPFLRISPLFRCPGCLLPIQQRRGKKKNAKPRTTLPVRLKEDVPQWGRKGAVIPVPIGQMRNHFHPRHLATYLPFPELRALRRSSQPIERDTAFGREPQILSKTVKQESKQPAARPLREPEPKTVELNLLPPAEAYALLDEIIPPTLEFFRSPIGSPEERQLKDQNPDAETLGVEKEAHTEAPALGETPRQTADNIFGSVNTADITSAIKVLIQLRGMDGRIVLPDEDVRFVHLGEELGTESEGVGITAERVKKLGEFEYEIKVKGWEGPSIRRVCRVVSNEEREDAARSVPSTGLDSAVTFGGSKAEERALDFA